MTVQRLGVPLSEIMESEEIYQIRRYLQGRYSVTLQDGRRGIGGTVGEALRIAKASAGVLAA